MLAKKMTDDVFLVETIESMGDVLRGDDLPRQVRGNPKDLVFLIRTVARRLRRGFRLDRGGSIPGFGRRDPDPTGRNSEENGHEGSDIPRHDGDGTVRRQLVFFFRNELEAAVANFTCPRPGQGAVVDHAVTLADGIVDSVFTNRFAGPDPPGTGATRYGMDTHRRRESQLAEFDKAFRNLVDIRLNRWSEKTAVGLRGRIRNREIHPPLSFPPAYLVLDRCDDLSGRLVFPSICFVGLGEKEVAHAGRHGEKEEGGDGVFSIHVQ